MTHARGRGKTDTDCIFGSIANCFPADSYDVSSEYSRVSFIPSGNFFFGGTFIVPKLKVNLSSPRFGESTSTAGSFGFGPSGSAAAGNRKIQVQIRFGF